MVPFADQINHENVDVNYDCLNPETGESLMSAEELEKKRMDEADKEQAKKREFLKSLSNDLNEIKA